MKLSSLVRHLRTFKLYVSPLDLALYIYHRLLRRLLLRVPMPCRGLAVGINMKGHKDPFYVRLGTTDWLVLDEIFQTGEYAFVVEHLHDVGRIVDLGANIGLSLRYWHELFPSASILAVEPDPGNLRVCLRNIQAARFEDQVTLVPACVGGGIAGEFNWRAKQNGPTECWRRAFRKRPRLRHCR